MYTILVRLMFLAALIELGIKLDFRQFNNPAYLRAAMNAVLTVDWKPISVFPKEISKFK